MFEPGPDPRVFAQPPGCDFPRAVVDGLRARLAGQPPDAMARVHLYVNTERMKRRIIELFNQGPATLLPRIKLITEIGSDLAVADIPPAVSPLRRRLELAQLVEGLLDQEPDLAPRQAIFPLANSLADLMDEMQGEAVDPSALQDLDVSGHSAYWARSLTFLRLVDRFFGEDSTEPPDKESRQRAVVDRIARLWATHPPTHPVIVAGSTGSRGATARFMETVARLPQGAVVLPGFDFDMPAKVWARMGGALEAEDHPQYRFHRFLGNLDLEHGQVRSWHDATAPAPGRNALVSLALRPAPVTDQWQTEGARFPDVAGATSNLSLIEATSPREEAATIAVILRDAAEAGVQAALISPDRQLTRQVTAALDRWRIRPDDSAGRPLPLTAPGRLLRHVADMRGTRLTGVDLLTLLKHPLTHSAADRNEHLRHTRDLELTALRGGWAFPDRDKLTGWGMDHGAPEAWILWISDLLEQLANTQRQSVADHMEHVLSLVELVAKGSTGSGSGGLWDQAAGQEARRIVDELRREAIHGGTLSTPDFAALFASVLNDGSVRSAEAPHPHIKIWGTLEARVGGAELVILAGLNEGTWPERPSPDPWMNRQMRQNVGLLLPERRIGLSAHDFQQAIGAPRVILSRAKRDTESETVPSRWINRLTNLLDGMSEQGKHALEDMRNRGADWLRIAREIDLPQSGTHITPLAPRPSPQPPLAARPSRLSFTQVERLIRDPYAIYGSKILGLRALDPLHQTPDAPLRGTVIHEVFDRFIKERPDEESLSAARTRLLETTEQVFNTHAPWPATRLLWIAKLDRIIDRFLTEEEARQAQAVAHHTEVKGGAEFGTPPLRLYGTADRIDRRTDGTLAIFDYKTGQPPSAKQQRAFDKQLLLEALVARAGGFDGVEASETSHVAYIGLGSKDGEASLALDPDTLDAVQDELEEIIASFAQRERGYTSRRVALREKSQFAGDFDHLARFGEWDHSTAPNGQEVGP